MTTDEFRADTNRTDELKSVLANPVLQEALLIINDSRAPSDVEGDSIASVRKLSNLAGRADVIRELYILATPIAPVTEPPPPDFGVKDKPPEGWDPSKI